MNGDVVILSRPMVSDERYRGWVQRGALHRATGRLMGRGHDPNVWTGGCTNCWMGWEDMLDGMDGGRCAGKPPHLLETEVEP